MFLTGARRTCEFMKSRVAVLWHCRYSRPMFKYRINKNKSWCETVCRREEWLLHAGWVRDATPPKKKKHTTQQRPRQTPHFEGEEDDSVFRKKTTPTRIAERTPRTSKGGRNQTQTKKRRTYPHEGHPTEKGNPSKLHPWSLLCKNFLPGNLNHASFFQGRADW